MYYKYWTLNIFSIFPKLYIIKSDLWRLVAFDKFTILCSFHPNQNIEHSYHPSTLRKQLVLWGWGSPGPWTWGIAYAKQVFYHWAIILAQWYFFLCVCICVHMFAGVSVWLSINVECLLQSVSTLCFKTESFPEAGSSCSFRPSSFSCHGCSGSKLRSSSLHNTHFTEWATFPHTLCICVRVCVHDIEISS